MTLTDSRGNAVTAGSRTALALCEQAIDQFAGFAGDPFAKLDAALAENPDFIMPHLVRGGILASSTERGAEPLLRECVQAASALSQHANERERAHLAALRAWLDRDFDRSVALYGRLLIDHPRDLFALQMAHLGDFYLGQTGLQRDRVARALPDWDAAVPGFGFVLGMYAFGLEENAHYTAAEETGRRAVELNPRDAWAIHAVAHVMEMQGRQQEGITWMTGNTEGWSRDSFFAVHNWWHVALYHLDLGQTDEALKLFDGPIYGAKSRITLEMIDASAMLWRMHLRGVDVGDRWQAVADAWEPIKGAGNYAFNDVHAAMAFVGAGRRDSLARVIDAQKEAMQRVGDNAMFTRKVGHPVVLAIKAFGDGNYAEALWRLR
ncbi:MAG TPA: tetratricopeptide repeat protein, partial [Burkholderiales bacterium]|nr:tetratricopeptide repeat protein [Burkholderiales bacterium]